MPNPPADMPSGLTIFAIGFVVMLAFVLLLWGVNVLPGKVREIMSRMQAPAKSVSAGLDQSVDQSVQTGLDIQTTPALASGLNTATPDMDAEQWPMPPISAYLTDNEFLVLLARQKTRSGGWRLSANAIVKVVGGDRTQVLKTVREVREGPAEYKPLSAEQAAAREALGLNKREVA